MSRSDQPARGVRKFAPFFIALEGIDGSGKSGHAIELRDALDREGYNAILTNEPGGSKLGAKIKELLADHSDGKITPMAEFALFCAARAQLLDEFIRPALEAGKVIVSDRSALSSLAYQGHGRGLDLDLIAKMTELVLGSTKPDLTIILKIDLETMAARLARRAKLSGSRLDRFELSGRDFHERVMNGYSELARSDRSIVEIDGRAAERIVGEKILKIALDRFDQKVNR